MKLSFHIFTLLSHKGERTMAAENMVPSGRSSPVIRQLESAFTKIGVTGAHKQILALVLIGCLFDSFEQNTIQIHQFLAVRPGGVGAQWYPLRPWWQA